MLLMLLMSLTARAGDDLPPVLSCEHAQLLDRKDDSHEDEKAKLVDSDFSVRIRAEGNGFVASVHYRGESSAEKDVTVARVEPSGQPRALAMAEKLVPGFDSGRVKAVTVGNVGVKANRRGTGIFVYELLGEDDVALARVASKGFSLFLCDAKPAQR